MCLRFVFLLITRLAAWLRLSRREEAWKTAEIFDPAPPARGPAAAAAAPPETELGRPGPARGPARRDTHSPPPRSAAAGHPGHDPSLAPRHHPAPPCGAVHARQDRPAGHPPEHQGPGPAAGPREPRMGLPADPRRAGRPGSEGSGVDGVGDSEECRNRAPRRAAPRGPGLPGRSSCIHRTRRSWRATSSQSTCSTAPRPMYQLRGIKSPGRGAMITTAELLISIRYCGERTYGRFPSALLLLVAALR